MSLFDKKFKKASNKPHFSDEEKMAGWESLMPELEAEFPVTSPSRGASPFLGLIAGIMALSSILSFGLSNNTSVSKYNSNDASPEVNTTQSVVSTENPSHASGLNQTNSPNILPREGSKPKEKTRSEINANNHVEDGRISYGEEPSFVADSKSPEKGRTASDNNLSVQNSSRAEVNDQQDLPSEDQLPDPAVTAKTQTQPEVVNPSSNPSSSTINTPQPTPSQEEGMESFENSNEESMGTPETLENSPSETALSEQEGSPETVAVPEEEDLPMQESEEEENVDKNEDTEEVPSVIDRSAKDKYTPKFYIGLTGGPQFNSRTLSADSRALVDYRNKFESVSALSWNVGFLGGYRLNKDFSVELGASYFNFHEEVNYPFTERKKGYVDSRWGSPSNYYDNIVSIDSVRIIDSINQGHWDYYIQYDEIDTTLRGLNGIRTYSFVEVPLRMVYAPKIWKVSPFISAGVIFGIPIENTATRYATMHRDIAPLNELTKIQYSAEIQLGATYPMTNSWVLRGSAQYAVNVNSLFVTEDFSQKYSRLGLQLGIIYSF